MMLAMIDVATTSFARFQLNRLIIFLYAERLRSPAAYASERPQTFL